MPPPFFAHLKSYPSFPLSQDPHSRLQPHQPRTTADYNGRGNPSETLPGKGSFSELGPYAFAPIFPPPEGSLTPFSLPHPKPPYTCLQPHLPEPSHRLQRVVGIHQRLFQAKGASRSQVCMPSPFFLPLTPPSPYPRTPTHVSSLTCRSPATGYHASWEPTRDFSGLLEPGLYTPSRGGP